MRKNFWLVLISFVALTFLMGESKAQILFNADFEDTKGPNNIDDWERVSPDALQFSIEDGKLKQTANETANSTKVLVPVDGSDWTDYTVAVDVWWHDNDNIALIFRYTGEESYYSFMEGATDRGNMWCIAKNLAPEKSDEGINYHQGESADKVLLTGENEEPIDESGATAYTMAVTVTGNLIEAFRGEQVDVLAGEMPPKVGEVEDNSFSKGTVGFYILSCPTDWDNFIVLGPAGPTAVQPEGKLSMTWGNIKSSVY